MGLLKALGAAEEASRGGWVELGPTPAGPSGTKDTKRLHGTPALSAASAASALSCELSCEPSFCVPDVDTVWLSCQRLPRAWTYDAKPPLCCEGSPVAPQPPSTRVYTSVGGRDMFTAAFHPDVLQGGEAELTLLAAQREALIGLVPAEYEKKTPDSAEILQRSPCLWECSGALRMGSCQLLPHPDRAFGSGDSVGIRITESSIDSVPRALGTLFCVAVQKGHQGTDLLRPVTNLNSKLATAKPLTLLIALVNCPQFPECLPWFTHGIMVSPELTPSMPEGRSSGCGMARLAHLRWCTPHVGS